MATQKPDVSMIRSGTLGKTKPAPADAKKLAEIRRSLFLRPVLDTMASDVAGLTYNIEATEYDTWQGKSLEAAIDTAMIHELMSWAWVFGEAIAEADIGLAVNNGIAHYIPTQFKPLDMSKVKWNADRTEISYNGEKIPLAKCLHLKLFTEAGNVFPMGSLYIDVIEGLNLLVKTWIRATCNNALGMLFLTCPAGTGAPSSTEQDDMLKLYESAFTEVGVGMTCPPGYTPMLISSAAKPDFQQPMNQLLFLLLAGLRSQYTLSSVTTPGTYGTVAAMRASYLTYVNSMADRVTDAINDFASQMAWYPILPIGQSDKPVEGDGLVTVKVTNTDAVDQAGVGYEFMAVLKGLIEMTPYLSPDQVDSLYQLAGIPKPVAGQNLPLVYPATTQATTQEQPTLQAEGQTDVAIASNDKVSKWMASKKQILLDKITDAMASGQTPVITLSGMSTLAASLQLSEQAKSELRLAEDTFNSSMRQAVKSQNILKRFNNAWKAFEAEVQEWMV